MISVREALTRAAGQLSAHPDLRPTAVPDATVLLLHTLELDRAALFAHPERPVSRERQAEYQRLLERRLAFEPIQYILGHVEFFGLGLRVTPAVLIPRPETELLVEAVLAQLPSNPNSVPHASQSHQDECPPATTLRIVDVGTGSAAIAIALAHTLPQASVTAVDLSPQALALARENAAAHHLSHRIRFLQSDLLAELADDPPFHAIVSNPPYIPAPDAPSLHPQVRDHEPALALFAGSRGLDIYERLIPQAGALLLPGGLLALEIGYGQQEAIAALLHRWTGVTFLDDLQGIPRVALARRAEPSSLRTPASQLQG